MCEVEFGFNKISIGTSNCMCLCVGITAATDPLPTPAGEKAHMLEHRLHTNT